MKNFTKAVAFATMCSVMVSGIVSCSKEDKPKALAISAGQTDYEIAQGQTLVIPVVIDELGKGVITAEVESSDAKYPATIGEFEYNTAEISVVAPEIITAASSFSVSLSVSDSVYGRTLEYTYNISSAVDASFVKLSERANCHIVKPGAIVMFPASIGNSSTNADADAAALLWQDEQGLVKKIMYEDNYVIAVLNAGVSGNALVGVSKDGKAAWDYLLWVCDFDPQAKVMTYTSSVTTDGATYQFMDRNIGAISGEASTDGFGLFYQWGRKEPFAAGTTTLYDIDNAEFTVPTVAAKDAASEAAVTDIYYMGNENPTTMFLGVGNAGGNYGWFLTDKTQIANYTNVWGAEGGKSVADPCPAGWRIPKSTAFYFFTDVVAEGGLQRDFAYDINGTAAANKMGRTISMDGGTTSFFFPLQGEFSNAGVFGSAYNGTATWPCGKMWAADADATNFRARAAQQSPTSVTLSSGLVTAYGCAVRCVKE